jgi:hypothetical protein
MLAGSTWFVYGKRPPSLTVCFIISEILLLLTAQKINTPLIYGILKLNICKHNVVAPPMRFASTVVFVDFINLIFANKNERLRDNAKSNENIKTT